MDTTMDAACASFANLQLECNVAKGIVQGDGGGSGSGDDEYIVDIAVTPAQSMGDDVDNPVRRPCDLVCIVDVSGSMQIAAMVKTAGGEVRSGEGMTRLCLVKQAIRMIAKTVDPSDRIALVVFSSAGKVLLHPTLMDAEGHAYLLKALDLCYPNGGTNLWEGLQTGLDTMLELDGRAQDRSKMVMLFTDGQPNLHPEGGILNALDRYLEEAPKLHFCLNTYGFGYDLDSALLLDIAKRANGMYTFVPDSSFVGTAFVNSISACLTMVRHNIVLCLLPNNGASITKVHGKYPRCIHDSATDNHEERAVAHLYEGDDDDVAGASSSTAGRWVLVQLGPVLLGQPRNAVVTVRCPRNRPCESPSGSERDNPFLVVELKVLEDVAGIVPPRVLVRCEEGWG